MNQDAQAKILSRADVAARIAGTSLRIGYTSGVFDLLHVGHLRYLQKARTRCDLLIVGVNSDSSVRKLKGPQRPIVPAKERAELIAGFSCVDLVFIFDEQNNQQNVSILKPAVYLKAGDYGPDKLSSAALVKSYGGQVEIVPFVADRSSTGLIDRIVDRQSAQCLPGPQVTGLRPALFIDRDGTIIELVEFISDPNRVAIIPGVVEAIKQFQAAGYWIIIVTNQPGIGLGYFTFDDFYRVNRAMLQKLRAAGIHVDKIYFCPHSEAESCSCRKPEIGLIERAFADLAIDRERSILVGDATMDMELGARAGLATVLVPTGLAGGDNRFSATPTHRCSLMEAAQMILKGG